MSRLIEETDPLGKKRQYAYDLAGNRTNSVDRLGRGRSFVHDALNLVSQERWHDATGAVMRTFTFAYDALDRVRQVNDPDAIETLTWEAVPGGKRLSERATYPGQTQRIVNYSYDGAGRLIDWQLFGILHARYTRDVAGHLRILTGEAGVTNRWRLEFWRDARGDLSELRRFIGLDGEVPVVNTFYTIDLCGCGLSSIEHRDASNQPLPGASIFFARSADGAITNLLDGTNTFAFTYDAAAQLTGATGNGIPTESYSYDANGNRLTSHLHASYTTETGNRTTSADQYALAYDDEGNLVTKSNQLTGDVFTFTWDHRNRLTQVMKANSTMPTGSFVTQYRYDGFDRRIAVIRGNQTNWTYYRAEQPIADYLNNETTPAELYFTGGEVVDDLQVVVRRGERFYWTLTDHLGSVRRVLDTNGVEVAALRYDSFGNPLGATGTRPNAAGRFGFTGRERDSDSGLQYNRARYFDPELGRFISVDPIGFESGEVNHYRYAKNDPLHLTDPSGTVAAIEFRILAGGILGCASSGITELFCDTYSLDLAKANKGDLAATCIAGAAGGALGGATGDPFVALLFTQAFALLAEKGGNAAGYDIDLGGILECAGGLLK
jgi:RHS repeat-associated protein